MLISWISIQLHFRDCIHGHYSSGESDVHTQLKYLPDLPNQCWREKEGGKCIGCHSNKPPCKNQAFCLPCENHFTHQMSLCKVGIKITVACALPGLLSWSDGSTSGSIQERECLQKLRIHLGMCLNDLQIWTFLTISFHLGPYNCSGLVNSRLPICIHN